MGALGGWLVTLAVRAVGLGMISEYTIIMMTLMCILLGRINSRWGCSAYGGGIISIYIFIVCLINKMRFPIDISCILFLVGALHMLESFLILLFGQKKIISIPQISRGKIVIKHCLAGIWFVPVVVLGVRVPFIALVACQGKLLPNKGIKSIAFLLMIYSIFLIVLSLFSIQMDYFKLIGVVYMIVGHEIMTVSKL